MKTKPRLSPKRKSHTSKRKRLRQPLPVSKQKKHTRDALSSRGKRKENTIKPNRKKQKKLRIRKKKKKGIIKEFVITLVVAASIFLLVFALTVRIPKVAGYAMIPTINDQDRLFIYKWGAVRRFSLIYFKDPAGDEWLIRRVIGLPGEELYYQDDRLFVNGEEVPERFLSTSLAEFSNEPLTEDFTLKEIIETGNVPEDCYFVLGDNRPYATDSRYFGCIKKSEITGVVKARVFPIHAMRQF